MRSADDEGWFSSARYFPFTCSADMSVPLFTGCAHPHEKGFHRGLGLGTAIACEISSLASLCRLVYIQSHCGQLRSFFLCCRVSCTAVRASPHLRLLEICNTGPVDCTAASLEPGTNMFWISAIRSLGIFWIICTCLCTCASSRCSDRPVQGMEPVCVMWRCCGTVSLGMVSLLALERSCTAAVKLQCSAVRSGR